MKLKTKEGKKIANYQGFILKPKAKPKPKALSTAPRQCMAQFSLPPKACKLAVCGPHKDICLAWTRIFIITSQHWELSCKTQISVFPWKKTVVCGPHSPQGPHSHAVNVSAKQLLSPTKTVSPLPNKLHHSLSPHPACSMQIHGLRAPAGKWACTQEVLGLQPSSPLSSLWQLWSLTGPESSHPECSSKRLEQDEIQGSPETHSQSR